MELKQDLKKRLYLDSLLLNNWDLTFDTRRTTLLSRRGKPFQTAVLRV